MWTNPPYLAGLHLQCLQETWLTLINSLIGIVCLNWMMMLLKTRQKLKALLLNLLKTSLQMQTGLHRARYETLLKEHELLKIHCDTIISFFSTEFIRIMKSSNGSPGEQWCIQLGVTDSTYHQSATIQVNKLGFRLRPSKIIEPQP